MNNATIKMHRQIDGISEEEFIRVLDAAESRKELMDHHGAFVARMNKKERWFDKTPQNVYGAFLLAGYYPDSQFVCIWRNPLNVVSSLVEGRQIKVDRLEGAINYWKESAIIMIQFENLYGDRLINLKYENLIKAPKEESEDLVSRLGEDPGHLDFSWQKVHAEQNRYELVLSASQIDRVLESTADLRKQRGY